MRREGKLLLFFILTNATLVGWGLYRRSLSASLRICFLDVGQGDGAVLETPSGKVILVDTGGISEDGGQDEGRRTVEPYLRHEGIGHIDAVVLTHPHADHIGGAATLMDDFPVDRLLDNGQDTGTALETHVLTEARAHRVDRQQARPGEEIDCGDGVTLRVLSPTAQEENNPPNNASVVLVVRYGRTSFLLTGDAEAEEEADLLRSRNPLACDVMKVGHHGSDTSTTPPFLAAAHPRFAIISVGAHNLYGHPSPEVVQRLQASGARLFRTDRNGAVTCVSDSVTVGCQAMSP